MNEDEAKGVFEKPRWSNLDAWLDVKVGNHSQAYAGKDRECSNQAESYFLNLED